MIRDYENELVEARLCQYCQEHYVPYAETRCRNCMDNATRAMAAVAKAIKDGRLLSAKSVTCSMCENKAQQYHHKSYSPEHWLSVMPLCIPCHERLHAKMTIEYRAKTPTTIMKRNQISK